VAAAQDPRPKLVAVPEHDQFRPPESAQPIVDRWSNTRMEVVKGADHYLVGRTDRAAQLALDFLKALTRA
jgi:alpha/beta superfamily hydrolase